MKKLILALAFVFGITFASCTNNVRGDVTTESVVCDSTVSDSLVCDSI